MNLRPAGLADAQILLDWRNDPETCKASRNTDPVSMDSHIAWLTSILSDHNRKLMIAEIDDGAPVGTVRFDRNELNWTTAPSHRNKGIATEMVKAAITGQRWPFVAYIKPDNAASQAVARKCGFSHVGDQDMIQEWRKDSDKNATG